MTLDPRHKNVVFDGNSAFEHFSNYVDGLKAVLQTANKQSINTAFAVLQKTYEANGKIYVAGNGGSAAIANHLTCDWMKGTQSTDWKPIKAISLCSNVPVMTALSNDYSYVEVFSRQLEMLAEPGDCLIVISSSGNSPNIIKALESAKKINIPSIAFTGFNGGIARQIADVSLHFEINNYGVVEDCHQILMQAMAQFATKLRDQVKPRSASTPSRRLSPESVVAPNAPN